MYSVNKVTSYYLRQNNIGLSVHLTGNHFFKFFKGLRKTDLHWLGNSIKLHEYLEQKN